MSTATASRPSPMPFFQTIHAYERTAALLAALALDVFTHLARRGSATAADLAEDIQAAPRGVRVLCDYLTIAGLLTKTAPAPDWSTHRWANTPDSQMFLDRRSPASLAESVSFLGHQGMMPIAQELIEAVRRGGGVHAPHGEELLADESPAWVEFARTMVPIIQPAADALPELLGLRGAGPVRILDVAAGHGMFGIRCAQANPEARITALDWRPVLQVAEENATTLGVKDRFSLIPGSAFEVEWGTDHDVVLLTNFLHHFDVAQNEQLLRKTRAALKPGGRVAILEFVPNDDRVNPPPAAAFAMIMLRETPAGDAYTLRELAAMLENTGFKDTQATSLDPHPETWVVGRG